MSTGGVLRFRQHPVRSAYCFRSTLVAHELPSGAAMGFKTIEEMQAYQLTRAFKLEVYRLIRASPGARGDFRFKSQVQEALSGAESNIAEGFRRWAAGEFAHFLRYAIASLEEGRRRLQDGIDREYFNASDCATAQELGERASKATTALQTSLRNLAERRRKQGTPGTRR